MTLLSERTLGRLSPSVNPAHHRFPVASDCVAIVDGGPDVGRHAVATKDIKPGEQITSLKRRVSIVYYFHR